MSVVTRQLFANIGCEACAKKEMVANSYTNMTCQKCQNAISTLDSMPVTIKSVHFYTLIQKAKSVIVHGMIEVFAGTAHPVDTDMCGEYCV